MESTASEPEVIMHRWLDNERAKVGRAVKQRCKAIRQDYPTTDLYISRHARVVEEELERLSERCWAKATAMLPIYAEALSCAHDAMHAILADVRPELVKAAARATVNNRGIRAEKIAFHILDATVAKRFREEYRTHRLEAALNHVGKVFSPLASKTVSNTALKVWVRKMINEGRTGKEILQARKVSFPEHETPSKRRVEQLYRQMHHADFGDLPKAGSIHPLLKTRRQRAAP